MVEMERDRGVEALGVEASELGGLVEREMLEMDLGERLRMSGALSSPATWQYARAELESRKSGDGMA